MKSILENHPMIQCVISERAWISNQNISYDAAAIIDDGKNTRIRVNLRVDTAFPFQTAVTGSVLADNQWRTLVSVPHERLAMCDVSTHDPGYRGRGTPDTALFPAFEEDVISVTDELVQILHEPE